MGGIGGRGGLSAFSAAADVVVVCVTPITLFPLALAAFFFPFGLPLIADGMAKCARGGGGMLRKGTFDVRSLKTVTTVLVGIVCCPLRLLALLDRE